MASACRIELGHPSHIGWEYSQTRWRRWRHHRLPPRLGGRSCGKAGPRGHWAPPCHRRCREDRRPSSWPEPSSTSSSPVTVASGPPETNGKLWLGGIGRSAVAAATQLAPSPASHRSPRPCVQDVAFNSGLETRESAESSLKPVREATDCTPTTGIETLSVVAAAHAERETRPANHRPEEANDEATKQVLRSNAGRAATTQEQRPRSRPNSPGENKERG